MGERIIIGVAWPYASGPLHLGHLAGAYLPADIFARYHRMRGDEVIMVSGSDDHGTPITIKADEEHLTPAEVARKYNAQFAATFKTLGISWDLFTSTSTPNHFAATQWFFTTLREHGFIYQAKVLQAYCPRCQRFMPDRYVEGICPLCGTLGARGDQCDACGKPLDTINLKEPRCRLCGTRPEFKESEHFFLKLSAFQERLLDWLKGKNFWRPNVINFTRHYLEGGLEDRAITRDMEWGVPIPLEGYTDKRIYVWFDAVIGYFSAAREWAEIHGKPDAWRDFWEKDAKVYNFIGKDNIIFHTIIWPAMLMGVGGLNLPYDVPANEFLNLESRKFSKSHHWAVYLPDYLSRYSPEPLRYYLSINMPETGDTDFAWGDFVRRNNDELVATYGNLAHRVLTFTYRNFNGEIPGPGELDTRSREMLDLARNTLKEMDGRLGACHFRDAIRAAMSLAQAANRYLDEKSPWKVIKTDRMAAATALYTAIGVLTALRTALYPFLPASSEKLNEYLGFTQAVPLFGWKLELPEPGQKLVEPQPLFTKLDDKVAEAENQRLLEGKG
jgi:methionyl-tRNA synthetase